MADQNDDIYDEGEFEDDGTNEMLDKMLADIEAAPEDDGGLNQPYEEPDTELVESVTESEGRDLISEADFGPKKKKEPKADEAAREDAGEDVQNDTPKKEDGAEKGEDTPDLTASDVASLLDGVPDAQKAEIVRRLSASADALKPFETDYVREQMQHLGKTPADVANRLVEIAQFSQENPDEYLAWAAQEMAGSPEKIIDVFNAAAERHGLKVVAETSDDDDDLFMDEDTRAMRDENAKLKARISELEGGGPSFGPDAPERKAQRALEAEINSFITEVGEDGNLKRPMFEQLRPQIVAAAQGRAQSLGRPLSIEDLAEIYDSTVDGLRKSFNTQVMPEVSAAQDIPSVQKQIEDKAAAAAKAARASKSIDGTGQGAARRPSIPKSGSLESQIDAIWDSLTTG